MWLRLKCKNNTSLIINNMDATLETLPIHLIFLILLRGTIIYLNIETRETLFLFLSHSEATSQQHSRTKSVSPLHPTASAAVQALTVVLRDLQNDH